MLIGKEVGGISGGSPRLPPGRGSRSGIVDRRMASCHGDPETEWLESMLKLVLKGSDALVGALYQRICTNRAGGSVPTQVGHPMKSSGELAELAVAEGTLTRAEARSFLRSGNDG